MRKLTLWKNVALFMLVAVTGWINVAAAANLIKGPYLIYPGQNSKMELLWQMDGMEPCKLVWGINGDYNTGSATTSEYGDDHQHKYTITNLTPTTKYYYKLTAASANYTGSFYAALPADATKVKFLAYGDTRTDTATHSEVLRQMIKAYTADPGYQTFTLHVGDWVNNGDSERDWSSQFFNPDYLYIQQFLANMPLNGCMGNHEKPGRLFRKYWPYTDNNSSYWSFDYGPAHIAVVDQYVASAAMVSRQYNWLESDLAATKKSWKFIVLHEPGWSAGNGHENNPDVQNYIQPLCLKYGVSIVFAGHNHYYARADVKGIQHITTGGGGAPLYLDPKHPDIVPDANHPYIVKTANQYHFCEVDIQGNILYFTARDKDGSVIESFTLQNGLK